MSNLSFRLFHFDFMSFEIYNKVGRLRGNYKYGALARKVLGGTYGKMNKTQRYFCSLPTSYLKLHDV